jgi:hypothetical protein
MEKVQVVVCKNPARRDIRDIEYTDYHHESVADLINRYARDQQVIASVNGRVVPVEWINSVRLKENDCLLLVADLQGGGDGGGKDFIGIVAMIALVIVSYGVGAAVGGAMGSATYTSAGIAAGQTGLTAMMAGTMASMGVWGYIASAVTMMVGGMLISSLSPTPEAEPLPQTGFSKSQNYSWQPQTIQQQGVVVPRIYGTHKIYGNVISTYINNNEDDTQEIFAIIKLGFGPIRAIYDIKLNDQSILYYHNVDIETRLGLLDQPAISFYNDTKISIVFGIKVSYDYPLIKTTDHNDFDSLEVDIEFPKGLFTVDTTTGDTVSTVMVFSVEVSPTGENNWEYITISPRGVDPVTHVDYAVESVPITSRWSLGKYITETIEIDPGSPDYESTTGSPRVTKDVTKWYEIKEGSSDRNEHNNEHERISAVNYQWQWIEPYNTVVTYEWVPPVDYYEQHYDGYWKTIVTRTGYPYDVYKLDLTNFATITESNTSSFKKTYKTSHINPGKKYDIRVTRITADNVNRYISNDINLATIREVYSQEIQYPRGVMIAIKSIAAEQLSGSFKLSGMVDGAILLTYKESCSEGTISVTLNSYSATVTKNVSDTWEELGIFIGYEPKNQFLNISGDFRTYRIEEAWEDSINPNILLLTLTELYEGDTVLNTTYSIDIFDTEFTSNPAWVFLDVACQPVLNNNLLVERFDCNDLAYVNLSALKEWATWCDVLVPDGNGGTEARCTFNGIFDTEMNVWDAVLKICMVGRAAPLWMGMQLTVIIDKDETPVQSFGMGQVWGFKETFLPMDERISEIEASFMNKDKDYDRDTYTAVDADEPFDNNHEKINLPSIPRARRKIRMTNKANLELFGVVKRSESWRLILLRLLLNRFIVRTVEFMVDIEAVGCGVGNVIYFQHDVPQWGDGGKVVVATAVTVALDKEVTLSYGTNYAMLIHYRNPSIVIGSDGNDYRCISSYVAIDDTTKPVTGLNYVTYWQLEDRDSEDYIATVFDHVGYKAGDALSIFNIHNPCDVGQSVITDTVTIASGTFDKIPDRFDDYIFGDVLIINKKFRIVEFSRDNDHVCSLKCMEHVPELYTAVDSSVPMIPVNPTTYALATTYAVVSNITAVDSRYLDDTRHYVHNITVRWKSPVNTIVKSYVIYYSKYNKGSDEVRGTAAQYVKVGVTTSNKFVIPYVTANTSYSICVCCVSLDSRGKEVEASLSVSAGISVDISSDIPTMSSIFKQGVSGIQIAGQSNDTNWSGTGVKFTWNKLVADYYGADAGYEGEGGAGYTPITQITGSYEIHIQNINHVYRRQPFVVHVEEFTYSLSMNTEDSISLNESSPASSFLFTIYAIDDYGRRSNPVEYNSLGQVQNPVVVITVDNTPPATPINLTVVSEKLGFYITTWTSNTEADIAGYEVHASQTQGFVPSYSTLIKKGTDTRITVTPANSGVWYIRVCAYDLFGNTSSYTSEMSVVVPKWIDTDDIELELMKMSFQNTSWAQFAIYDSFADESNRLNPDTSVNKALIYKNNLVTFDNIANRLFGFISKSYSDMTTLYTGSSTGVGLNFLTDTSKSWYTNECKNLTLTDSVNNTFNVTTNNSNTLTIVGTPVSGSYTLKTSNPTYMLAFCTFEDSTQGGGAGYVKLEVTFDGGSNWQTVLDTENNINSLEGTVAILHSGSNYQARFTLKNDSDGNGPIVRKFLVCTDPSPWRF